MYLYIIDIYKWYIYNIYIFSLIFEQRPEGSKGTSHARIYRKSFSGRKNNRCKIFETGACLETREITEKQIVDDEVKEAVREMSMSTTYSS